MTEKEIEWEATHKTGQSETSKLRHLLSPYCEGDGIDVGCGQDKIKLSAIAMDLTIKEFADYGTNAGGDPIQLHGDCRNLTWFKDSVLDYLYNSHTLEDFENTKDVIKEWIRVIKNGGKLILNLPHDRVFFAHCQQSGQPYNFYHKCYQMSIEWMRQVTAEINQEVGYELMKEIYYTGILHIYCFGVVYLISKR